MVSSLHSSYLLAHDGMVRGAEDGRRTHTDITFKLHTADWRWKVKSFGGCLFLKKSHEFDCVVVGDDVKKAQKLNSYIV